MALNKRGSLLENAAINVVWLLVSEPGVKNQIFEKFKKVIKMSWESIFLDFMGMIFPIPASDLAGNWLNEPKQRKSIIFSRHLPYPRFTKKKLVL